MSATIEKSQDREELWVFVIHIMLITRTVRTFWPDL